jgi:hypothetical protein
MASIKFYCQEIFRINFLEKFGMYDLPVDNEIIMTEPNDNQKIIDNLKKDIVEYQKIIENYKKTIENYEKLLNIINICHENDKILLLSKMKKSLNDDDYTIVDRNDYM